MKNISEYIDNCESTGMINEVFSEPHIAAMFAQGGKPKDIVSGLTPIKWADITSADIKIIPPTKELINRYTKKYLFIIIIDDIYQFVWDGDASISVLPGCTIVRKLERECSSQSKHGHLLHLSIHFSRIKDLIAAYADEIMLISYEKFANTGYDRAEAKRDMVPVNDFEVKMMRNYKYDTLEGYYKAIIDVRFKEYKKIIAKNRALKDDDFEAISKRVNKLFEKMMSVMNDISIGKIETASSYAITGMMNMFSTECKWSPTENDNSGLLGLVKSYADKKRDIIRQNAYNVEREVKEIENLKQVIIKKCDIIERKLAEFK